MAISFRTWLEQQTGRDGSRGRFARDVCGDAKAPDGSSKQTWLDHLARCNAGPGATAAFEEAWTEFSQLVKTEGGTHKIMLTIRMPICVTDLSQRSTQH